MLNNNEQKEILMNKSYQQLETEINIKEITWDLLEQWKAVLIVALATMLLVVGLKYAKDTRAYNSALDQEKSNNKLNLTNEERIEEALVDLTEDDRATVEYLIKQDEWIESEKDYINKSIRLKTNPTSQRTLEMTYHIKVNESEDAGADAAALIFGYNTQVKRGSVINALGQIIDPNADNKYIAELVTFEDDGRDNHHASTESDEAVMSVRVVLPDETDSEKVKEVIDSAIKKCSEDLSTSICVHKIRQIQSSESYTFNRDAVDTRNNILYSINNLMNNKKNITSTLRDEANSALEKVEIIKKEATVEEDMTSQNSGETEDDALNKPGISKKYALLGFVLGAMAYSFAYLIWIILRGRINCASDVENYSQFRLIGEVYEKATLKGAEGLFNSKTVDKFRYKNKQNAERQINKAATSLETASKHDGADNITMLSLSGSSDLCERLMKAINTKGIKASVVDVTNEEIEPLLLNTKNVGIVVNKDDKVEDLANLANLIREYEVPCSGVVYLGKMATAF